MLENLIKKIVPIIVSLGLSFGFLGASDDLALSEIFVPYDEDGFYGGSIIMLFIFYVGIFIGIAIHTMIIFLIGGLIAYFFFPKIIQEFKLLIGLYYSVALKEAFRRHFIHFLVFTPMALYVLFLIYKFFEPSYFYLLMLLVFLYSSFFGFYIFLYAVMALYFKNWTKVLIALVLGGGIFIFFASSGYFVFEPIYNKIYGS